jgi:ABC-type polysaccharide/polyol phosphate export permease
VTIAQTQIRTLQQHDPRDGIGRDLYEGVRNWRMWTMLGWNDIRRRYRRSILGPFWLTISMSLLVAALGSLYAQIFHMDIASYLPYLTLGFIAWGFISATIKDSCQAFWSQGEMIKQIRVPFTVYVLRMVWGHFIVLLHTIIIIVPIWIYFHHWPDSTALLAIPGLFVIILNLVWVGVALAVLNTRFRDVLQIVETVLQITVFATPIMWPVSALGNDRRFIADINPMYHLIELMRAPLLGEAPSTLSWLVALGVAAAGLLLTALLLRRVDRRIVYWL